MRRLIFGFAMLAMLPAYSGPVGSSPPLPDERLGDLRGGFRLPGGLDVAIAVTTQTRIDGALAVRSVFRIDNGAPRLTVHGPDGAPVAVDGAPGAVRLQQQGGTSRITFSGTGIDVTHLAGRAFGAVIANSADNRAIDTTTTIDLNIANASPALIGSALLRADQIAASAGDLVRR